ncbi:MAG: ATP-binding protein [Bacteroidota bacterium]
MKTGNYILIDIILGFFRLPHSFISIFIFLAIFTSPVCEAQIRLSNFSDYKVYTKENGLASTYITDFQEDKYGFLWIATGKGISRYDGNHFANFTYYLENSSEHDIGFVNSLVIDEAGENLWVASENGIFYTSIDTINFKKIDKLIPSIDFSLERTFELLLDSQNVLWATSLKNGLLKIDLKKKNHERFSFTKDSLKDKFLLNSLGCIVKDPNDNSILWIGTAAGLIRFNSISNEYRVYVYKNDPEMAQNKIRKIHVSNEEVFLGTWGKGLIIFNKQSEQFSTPLINSYPNSHTLILDIFKENSNNLWVTSSDGLIQYDVDTKTVKKIINNNLARGILRGISFIDSRGIIWYGYSKGLFKFDPLLSQNTFIELEKRNDLQYQMLTREIILSDGFYYVLGHASTGLYKINSTDYTFEVIDIPYLKNGEGPNITLRDMVEMDNGNFLIVSGKEILIFNPKTEQIKLSPLQIDHPYPSIQTVVKDKDNNFWIGSRTGGLFCLNFEDNTIKNYKKEFNEYRDGNHEWIENLYLDSNDNLWIRNAKYLSVMDLKDYSIQNLSPDKNRYIFNNVGWFQEDSEGRIWVTGHNEGAGFLKSKNLSKGINHKLSGYYKKLYKYNDSLLWTIGKSLGILNINSLTHKEINFNYLSRKLNFRGPVVNNGKGEFLIGCNNGILIYNPEKQSVNQEIPIPYIRKIESHGKTLYEGNSLTNNDFNFKSDIKHLVFKISSLGFHLSDQISYQYKFEDEWQNIGSSKEINLTNLSYGDYNLKIKACNNLGICNEIPKEFNIKITTPWWATWWAYIIYFGIAILFADRFYRFQLSKRLAIAESERLKEINQLKNSLYTNITHEFRTPLTVILGMADSLKSNIENKLIKETEHSLEMIKRNGKNLLRLVNEMLDLSKLESGNMKLQLVQADAIQFVKYMSDSFHSLARAKQINLTTYSEVDQLLMDFDTNKMSSIISNLLSNAIKFTPPEGKIIVHLKKILKSKNEFLFIKVKDSGLGISADEINNIFNRFYQVNDSSSRRSEGSGIGLALTKEFVELMHGTIEIKSVPGKGSEFTIQLPITNTAKLTEDIKIQSEPNLPVSTNSVEIDIQISDDQSELPLALIIEDNKDVAHYLKTCLTGKYQTIHEPNGEIGIDTAFEKVPDIIICDVMMPVKDGFEVCSTLKTDERTDHIPIILLTAKVTMKDRLTGLSCGADAYLTKPFVKAELFTRLDQLVLLRKKMIQKIEGDSFSQFLKKPVENPETKFLQKIIKIIHEEISNHSFGSSTHLSQKMHLSESQIYRKLKAITGKSTAVFIRSVRLQKAKELILTTDKTISEIAYEVGFNDPSWFSRAFKEEFGFAPSAIPK